MIIEYLDVVNGIILVLGVALVNLPRSKQKATVSRVFSYITVAFQLTRVLVTILLLQNRMSQQFLKMATKF